MNEKKAKRMIKATIPEAIVTLLLSIVVLSVASFAWLNTSNTATAEGINLTITVPSDIVISLTGEDGSWTENLVITTEDLNRLNTLQTAVPFYILPASSFSATNGSFFTTASAALNGAASPNTLFSAVADTVPIAELKDGIYQSYYIDVPLYFKTADNVDFDLYLEKATETLETSIHPIGTSTDTIYKSVRVGFINPSKTKNSTGGTSPLVLSSDEANTSSVITSSDILGGAPIAPVYLTFPDNYSNLPVVNMYAVDYGAGKESSVSQIIVRIWVEGQDAACTVGHGGQQFQVDLRFTRKY